MYEDNLNANFEEPTNYTERLQTLKQQMPPILDDFVKYFVLYNKDPSIPEYQNMFENIKSNLNKLSSSLFILSNDVDANIDNINKFYEILNNLIKKERDKNLELKKQLGMIETNINSSNEMIHDYNKIYDIGYLRNWALFLSIIISGLVISSVFKKQTI